MKEENKIILYQDDNEITRISVRFADEDLWLTQNQLADIYCTTQQNISQHVDNIYKDGELVLEATNKKFLLVGNIYSFNVCFGCAERSFLPCFSYFN